jgi:uncharacterized protein
VLLRQGLFATLRDGLDGILRLKLEGPLGKDLAGARGQRAEFWRSSTSLAVIDANLAALEAITAEPDGLAGLLQADPESSATAAVVLGRLADARAAVRAVPKPLAGAVGDPAARPAVEALATEVRELRARVVERLGPALGVASGFNALDGD